MLDLKWLHVINDLWSFPWNSLSKKFFNWESAREDPDASLAEIIVMSNCAELSKLAWGDDEVAR